MRQESALSLSNQQGMSGIFREMMDGLLNLIFPQRCEVCGLLQEPVICPRCREQFMVIGEPCCRQCGVPFDPLAKTTSHCAECREDPPPFDVARAAGVYRGALRRAIHLFKYDGIRAMAEPLGQLLAEQVALPFPIDCLCPVPLHPKRLAMRGFNQSRLLAKVAGTIWRLPVEDLLTRTHNTPPQMSLPAEERRQNIRNAFTTAAPISGRAVGLVDDVFTTGSTLRECSRILKRAGAERVLVLTVARTTVSLFDV